MIFVLEWSSKSPHLFIITIRIRYCVRIIYFLPLLLSSRSVNYLPCSNYSINCTFFLWARDVIINIGISGDLTFPNDNINFTILYSVIEGVNVFLSVQFFWLIARWHLIMDILKTCLSVGYYQQHMVLTTTLYNYVNCCFNDWGKRCWTCNAKYKWSWTWHQQGHKSHRCNPPDNFMLGRISWYLESASSKPSQGWWLGKKLNTCWSCVDTAKWKGRHNDLFTKLKPYKTDQIFLMSIIFHPPSPNPKHGMRLSSSKGERVLPIIEMACW